MITNAPAAAVQEEDPSVVVRTWPHGPRSVGRARRLLARHLAAWNLTGLTDSAQLIVSELVTNAVVHAREPRGCLISTRFERLEGGVRIEVHDANPDKPGVRNATAEAECGRGLALVDALTDGRWGVSDRVGVGKLVWAECAVSRPAS